MTKKVFKGPINNYKDFMSLKIDNNKFNNDYIKYGGICPCSQNIRGGALTTPLLDMPTFISTYLPALKGGYDNRKIKKGGEPINPTNIDNSADFNIFRDVLTIPGNGFQASTNITNDMTTRIFNYPSTEQTVSRSLF
jgi:hypothetical protein